MTDSFKYQKNVNVTCREELPEGAILYDDKNDTVMILNMMGLLVWKRVQGKMSREDLIRNVCREFDDVEEETARNDINEYVDMLFGKGFLTRK